MQKFISDTNFNLIIIPLTQDEAESREDYLTAAIALPRAKEEFVLVMSEDEMSEAIDGYPTSGFSFVSYGRYNKASLTDKEKVEIEELLLGYGRQWFRKNGIEILESIH